MGKMSLAWIDSKIECEIERGNNPDAVRDLAALVTVREYLSDTMHTTNPVEAMRQYGLQHDTASPMTRRIEETSKPDTMAHARSYSGDHLTRAEAEEWVESMEDKDGIKGGAYTWHQAQQYGRNVGIEGEQRLIEFYAAMNAMQSDFWPAAKKFGVDRPEFYAMMAKCFIMDPDAVEDKVLAYYNNVAKHK